MKNSAADRFRFIAHALNGDGPFRPAVSFNYDGSVSSIGSTYLVRYPRESDEKFARRNELAFFASPLAQAVARFVGYLSEKPPQREIAHPLYKLIADDADGKGTSLDVFLQDFMREARARGTMLLLVDMPKQMPASLAGQILNRAAPFMTPIYPEAVTEYEIGQDGKFAYVQFRGSFVKGDGERVDCEWRFDRNGWKAIVAKDKRTLDEGTHTLRQCPVLLFVEGGDFPHFGAFAPLADLSRRLFNLDSELDEILRAQTFSLLTMQVAEGSTNEQKIDAAKAIGQTIGTSNLMVHSGATPAFIAPPDGPARIYLDRIDKLRQLIDDISLAVASPNQRESGISMQMRFHAINAALSKFAERMEDFERRVWDICRLWLGMQQAPVISWSRNFNMAEVDTELRILSDMNSNAMPRPVIVEQQKRIVALQFSGVDDSTQGELFASIDEQIQERRSAANTTQ